MRFCVLICLFLANVASANSDGLGEIIDSLDVSSESRAPDAIEATEGRPDQIQPTNPSMNEMDLFSNTNPPKEP